jgi:hypothetical protein
MAWYKLFTKEDPNRLHKTLGLLSVISFLYRYLYVFPKFGSLGLQNDLFSWCTLLVHLLLSTSSLIFHVLPKRIINKPMIIWEEYRLHAIVFSLRCFSVWSFHHFKPEFLVGTETEYFLLYMTVMLHHVVVDKITDAYGTPGQTAVRVKNDDSNATIWYAKRYYGFYQFSALASHLLPGSELGEMGFNALIAIQSSAFLMTLFRKGLIEWYSHAFWYTTCLILSQMQMYRVFGAVFFAKILVLFLLRIKLRMNKYLIWALFSLSHTPWGVSLFSGGLAHSNAQFQEFFATSSSLSGEMSLPGFDFTLTPKAMMLLGFVFMGGNGVYFSDGLTKLAERPLAYALETKKKYVGLNVRKRLYATAGTFVPDQVHKTFENGAAFVNAKIPAWGENKTEATAPGPLPPSVADKVHAH